MKQLLIALALATTSLFTSAFAQEPIEPPVLTVDPYVKIVGKDRTGSFFKYDIAPSLDNEYYYSSDFKFTPHHLLNYIPLLDLEIIDIGMVECVVVCKNQYGEVVGLNPYWYEKNGYDVM